MIAAIIGRTFLDGYNKLYNQCYTAKEFYNSIYFEKFLNHSKYFIWAQNSPFVQMKKGQEPNKLTEKERLEKLGVLHEKIKQGDRDASIAIGFPASEEKEYATTSGLITDMNFNFSDEEVYLTWIGTGLSIGVAGGYSIFMNHEKILLDIFKGWQVYRSFLNNESLHKLKGNQIITWNGQWLNFFYSKDYKDDFDFTLLSNARVFETENTKIEVCTVKWSRLFFNLSNQFPTQTIIGYIFSLGQTNKTLGFIPFHFKQGQKLFYVYKQLFGENAALKDATDYENLFGLHIKRACELGSIGLQALEPEGLRKYMTDIKFPNFSEPGFSLKKGETEETYRERLQLLEQKDYRENIIPFRTYKTWLKAMITKNKEETLDYTAEVAKALHKYKKATTKTDRGNLIKNELLVAKTKKAFLDALSTLIKDVSFENLNLFKDMRDRIHLMTQDDFGYFVVLLKFDYAFQERNQETKEI